MQQQQVETSKHKKSVTFAPTASMRLALHLNDYTDEEMNACYFSRQDFYRFKEDVKVSVRIVEITQQKLDDEDFCKRGVECYTKDAMKVRNKIRRASQRTVLSEQDKDQSCEKIASLYAILARPCATAAYMVGLSDAKVVQEIVAAEDEKAGNRKKKQSPATSARALFSFSKIKRGFQQQDKASAA